MAWVDLAPNQMVSFTDAQTSGFNLQPGQSQVTSNQCMTRSEALTKYVLDSSYMVGYLDNQLVPKSTWVAPSIVAQTYILFGTDTSQEACANLIAGPSFHSQTTRFTVSAIPMPGDLLYDGPGLTNPTTFPIPVYYAYYINNNNNQSAWIYVDVDGTVLGGGNCS